MRIFQFKTFKRWAEDEGLTEADLRRVIEDMEGGSLGSNLGGNVFKKRIALEGRGKRSGARTIIAYKSDIRAFFIVGYAKNEKDNVDRREETALKRLAKELLSYTDEQLQKAIAAKEWCEIFEGSER